MQHIYLSPHLDDALYSCGGLICSQRQTGEAVTVLNLCAGIPDYGNISSFARSYHERWGNIPNMVEARRSEDEKTLTSLGIRVIYLDTLDSIYRTVDGQISYPDLEALFSSPREQDSRLLPEFWREQALRLLTPGEPGRFYAPLAIGGHVDHFLARQAGIKLAQSADVWFYEDFPHAEDPLTLEKLKTEMGLDRWQHQAFIIDVQAKIRAMCGYETQTGKIFGDERGLEQRVKDFTSDRARDLHWKEKLRYTLAGSGGRRERIWRKLFGYHAHAERYWSKI